MRKIAVLFFLFSLSLQAQNDSAFVDNKYLEDQIYFNLTYIQMLNLPDRISQSGFSFGLGGGFIKDFPINKRRNIALGAGLGYGLNNYYFNVKLDAETPSANGNLDANNKIIMHTVELPVELRFRGSTASKYKFWRFYPGIKIAYVFAKNTNFGKSADFDVKDIVEINESVAIQITMIAIRKFHLIHVPNGIGTIFIDIIQPFIHKRDLFSLLNLR